MTRPSALAFLTVCFALLAREPRGAGGEPNPSQRTRGLEVVNGWYVHNNRVVWGYGQHNGWWRAGQRANVTRRDPGQVAPNRTEDLEKLTDAMQS